MLRIEQRWASDCVCIYCGRVWVVVDGRLRYPGPKSCPYDDRGVEPTREYVVDWQVADDEAS